MRGSGVSCRTSVSTCEASFGAAASEARTSWWCSSRARWLATRETFVPAGFIDLDALYSHNLISGALRAEA